MTDFTPEARGALDRYLHRVRLSLRGTSVDADEVERDVREHIDAALDTIDGPVGADALDDVLRRLGSPTQWVPEDEIPLWRRALRQWQLGTEDWRLAYLSFGLVVLGMVTLPLGGPVLWIPAYFLSRAACAMAAERGESLGARAWLVLPPVVLASLALLIPLVMGPLLPFAIAAIEEGWAEELLGGGAGTLKTSMQWAARTGLIGLSVGVWWILLAPLSRWTIRPLRALLYPLLDRYERRHALLLALAGVLVSAVCAGLIFLAV